MTTKRKKLIDRIQEQLLATGHKVKRGGWHDGVPGVDKKKDWCEWLDVNVYSKDNNRRYTINLYFEKNATILTDIHVYKSKKKKGYTASKLIALKKGIDELVKEEVKNDPAREEYTIIPASMHGYGI